MSKNITNLTTIVSYNCPWCCKICECCSNIVFCCVGSRIGDSSGWGIPVDPVYCRGTRSSITCAVLEVKCKTSIIGKIISVLSIIISDSDDFTWIYERSNNSCIGRIGIRILNSCSWRGFINSVYSKRYRIHNSCTIGNSKDSCTILTIGNSKY